MGLRKLTSSLVGSAFNIVGDLKDAVTVHYITALGAYDPVTDTEAESTSTTLTFQAVFTRFQMHEVDASVNVNTDMKVLVKGSDLTNGPPQPQDTLISNGISWQVQNFYGVPGNSLYVIHVRKVSS